MRYPELESGKGAYRTYQCGVSQLTAPDKHVWLRVQPPRQLRSVRAQGAGGVKEVGNSAVCAGKVKAERVCRRGRWNGPQAAYCSRRYAVASTCWPIQEDANLQRLATGSWKSAGGEDFAYLSPRGGRCLADLSPQDGRSWLTLAHDRGRYLEDLRPHVVEVLADLSPRSWLIFG